MQVFDAMSRVVIGIPHAGVAVPLDLEPAFLPRVEREFLLRQSDAYTDRLYDVPGATVVRFPWSRFVADPNRWEDQIDEGGVVPVTDFEEQPLYAGGEEPTAEQRWARVRRFHQPYHRELARQVEIARAGAAGHGGGRIFFLDGHSMFATAPLRSPDHGRARPDAVLGNLGDAEGAAIPRERGLSCPTELTRLAAERLGARLLEGGAPDAGEAARVAGTVQLNEPFPGGYGVCTHSAPERGVLGLQVELNQRLWVDPGTWEPLRGRIDWMRRVLTDWVADLGDLLRDGGAGGGERGRTEVAAGTSRR
jgi:N-formylglutamate amidohydrolase